MKSSEIWVLVATVVSFCGAMFCLLRVFTKPVNYMRKADRPVPRLTTDFIPRTHQRTRSIHEPEAALTA